MASSDTSLHIKMLFFQLPYKSPNSAYKRGFHIWCMKMWVLRKSNLWKSGSVCVCNCFQRKLVVIISAGFSSNLGKVFIETIWLLWASPVILVTIHYNFLIQLSELIQPHCWSFKFFLNWSTILNSFVPILHSII